MSIEANIAIKIHRAACSHNKTNVVEIISNRRTDLSGFLNGKSPGEAISILPVVFNVCGKAHTHAAKMALGQHHHDSYLTVLCENAREHLIRIFTGWNIDKKTNMKQIQFGRIIGLVSSMETAIEKDRSDIEGIAGEITAFLHGNIFHCRPDDWLELKTSKQLEDWAARTPSIAARFIHNIYQKNWQSIGSVEPYFLPDIPGEILSGEMHQSYAHRFISEPKWSGHCCETGTLARNSRHPLITALAQKYGYGLLVRQIARLIELAKIPSDITRIWETLNADENIPGFGQVETARGRLTHSVVLDDGVIVDYKILAPTEWNFHPEGVVARSLASLPLENENDLKDVAKMVIEAIDPCVAYDVRVQ